MDVGALHRTKDFLWFAALAAGLAFVGVWTNVLGNSDVLFSADAEVNSTAIAFREGRLVIGLALIPFARAVQRHWNLIVGLSVLVLLVSTGLAVLAPHQTLINASLLCNASVLTGSMCYTVLTTSSYMLLAYSGRNSAAAATISASLLAEMILSNMVMRSESFGLHASAVMASPVLLGAFLLVAFAQAPFGKPPTETPRSAGRFKLTENLCICRLLIYTVALVCIKRLSSVGVWGANRGLYLGVNSVSTGEMLIICLLVAAMTTLVFLIPIKRLSAPIRSTIGLAVVLAGLQVLALEDDLSF